MSVIHAIILGVVQGVAEFLPISSSGHLVVLQRVFGFNEPSLTFDIVVHLGSFVAVVAVFRKDILALIKKPVQKMTGLLIIGTLPAVAAGLFLRSHIEGFFRSGIPLAVAFIATGVFLMLADRFKPGAKTENEITYADALVVGLMQAVGIPPGVSRSGATITGALSRGIERKAAARFSFLLAVIAIAGAGALEGIEIITGGVSVVSGDIIPMAVGFVTSAVVGYFSVRLLLKLIEACKLKYFSFYVWALAVLIIADAVILNLFFDYM